MAVIQIPEPIQILDPNTGAPLADAAGEMLPRLEFSSFVCDFLRNHPLVTESYSGLKAVHGLIDEFAGADSGSISLSDDESMWLRRAFAKPLQVMVQAGQVTTVTGWGYHPAVTLQLMPFIETIMSSR